MMAMTREQQNNLVTDILTSDFAKTLLTIFITVASFSYFVISSANDIKSQIKEVQYKIELQNISFNSELKNIKDKQDRDYKYFNEVFVRKSDLNQYKK